MSEHDEARQMLDAFRRSVQPTKRDQVRVRDAIDAIETRRAWWTKVLWRCTAIAAVGAAALVIVMAWMRSQALVADADRLPSEAPSVIESPPADAAHERAEANRAPARAPLEPAVAPVVEPPPAESTAPVVRPRSVPVSPPSAADGAAPEKAADAVRAEAALVERAHRALDDDDFDTVIALAGEHTRRFAEGVLALEVGALRALALCGAGRREQGRGEAIVFLRDHPRAPYRDRIRRACGVTDPGEVP
jgi:type IV secretory pathway VirB10-like protein